MTTASLDLSIIILPGSNIRQLHKLILNIATSLDNDKKKYEIHIQKNEETVKYLKAYPNASILLKSPKELFTNPQAKVTAIFEENSLVSPNWLSIGIQLAKDNMSAVYHSNMTVFTSSNKTNYIWAKTDSTSTEALLSLSIKNQWDFPVILNSSLMTPLLFTSLWAYTENNLAHNIQHLTIPATAVFKNKSPSETSLPAIYYSELYEKLPQEDTYAHKSEQTGKKRVSLTADTREFLRKSHVWMKRRSKIYKSIIMPVLENRNEKTTHKKIPEWGIQAWKQVHVFDRTTFPTRDALRSLEHITTLSVEPGLLLQKMLHSVTKKPDYIFLSQHMMKGGGDKVVLNYIKAMADIKPKWKITLIVTEDFRNTWENEVPQNVDYIDFGQLAKRFDSTTRYILLMRLISQLETKKMMLAMTPFAFEMVEKYAQSFIDQKYQIDSVAFCSDTDKFGRTWGIHFFGIPETFPVLHKIVTDNQHVIDETIGLEPLAREKFAVHYQPVEYALKAPRTHPVEKRPFRILWASRVANQKRPDVVLNIAKKIDASLFLIDMYGNLEDEYTENDFSSIPALRYKGGFSGFNSLPLDQYDALLYTSSFDGIPNIILEATAFGLPLIAPRVGGIDEFVINNKTGVLIENIEDIDAFVDAIKRLSSSPDKASSMVFEAQALLNSQHSYARFKKAVEKDLL